MIVKYFLNFLDEDFGRLWLISWLKRNKGSWSGAPWEFSDIIWNKNCCFALSKTWADWKNQFRANEIIFSIMLSARQFWRYEKKSFLKKFSIILFWKITQEIFKLFAVGCILYGLKFFWVWVVGYSFGLYSVWVIFPLGCIPATQFCDQWIFKGRITLLKSFRVANQNFQFFFKLVTFFTFFFYH